MRLTRAKHVFLLLFVLALSARVVRADADPVLDYRFPAFTDEERRELEKGEVWVRVESYPGSDVKTGHVIAILPYPMELIRKVVEDLGRFKEFIPDLLESTVLEPDRGDGCLFRSGIDLPWPVENRFWTIRVWMFDAQVDGAKVRVQRWEYVPGSGNIKGTRGRWVMRPYEPDPEKTIVSYFVHTDPGGLIPDFLVNFATKVYLPELIGALRERLQAVAEGRLPAAAASADAGAEQ